MPVPGSYLMPKSMCSSRLDRNLMQRTNHFGGWATAKIQCRFGRIEIELKWLEMSIFRRKKTIRNLSHLPSSSVCCTWPFGWKEDILPINQLSKFGKIPVDKTYFLFTTYWIYELAQEKKSLQFLSETTSQPSIKAIQASVMPKPKLPLRAKFFLRSSYSFTFKPFSKISSQERLGGPPTGIFVQQTEEFRSHVRDGSDRLIDIYVVSY